MNLDREKLCTENLEEMAFFKTGIKIFCVLLAISEGAKPMKNFNQWAERRGRSAIVREWGLISPNSRKDIVDIWEKNGSISKAEAIRLLGK